MSGHYHPSERIIKSKSYQYALHYLSRYPKTRKELEMKLLQKWFAYEDIQDTIEVLEHQDVVNDSKFADSYIYSECVRKGKPLIAVKNKLFQKWIDKDIIDERLNHHADGMEHGMSQKIIKEIDNYKKRGIEWLDIIQKLMRKWYGIDQIKEAIRVRDSQ